MKIARIKIELEYQYDDSKDDNWIARDLMNMDKDGDYCWGIVEGNEVEMGSFSMRELEGIKRPFGLGIERDLHFEPMRAKDVWDKLNRGEHV